MLRILRNPWFLFGLGLWQLVVVFTPLSLYGIWSDILFLALTSIWVMRCAGKGVFADRFARALVRGLSTGVGLCLFAFMALQVMFNMGPRSVPQQHKFQGIWFVNQYFRATGAWGCGYGSLTTAKAPVFFPLVEYCTEFDPCTNEDWGCFIEKGSWEACGY